MGTFYRPLVTVLLILCAPVRAASQPWWSQATFYEIFVRSFQDSNGDGIGDLNGVTQRLDYLNNGEKDDVSQPHSLGVKGLWLTPIFPSRSYHGYDATDFKAVDPAYGTMADLKKLIADAHRRGIRVLLDIAVNHTSREHPWFKDSQSSVNSAHRDWYLWRKEKPSWGKWFPLGDSFYYSTFGAHMPQLNWSHPSVVVAVKDIFKYWMKQGVDGFRLDAARYYVPGPHGEPDTNETHQRIADFVSALRGEFPKVLFVGEIWADDKTINRYCENGKELDLAFSFPLSFRILDALKYGKPELLAQPLQSYLGDFKRKGCGAPFLTNHDMDRVASQLQEDSRKLSVASALYFLLPGTPFVYYGEEIGLPNGRSAGDLAKRVPMQWSRDSGLGFTSSGTNPWQPFVGREDKLSVEAQEEGSKGLLAHYRGLVHLRNRWPILSMGSLSDVRSFSGDGVVTWQRRAGAQTVFCVANVSQRPSSLMRIEGTAGVSSPSVRSIYGGGKAAWTNRGRQSFLEVASVPPFSVQVFLVE